MKTDTSELEALIVAQMTGRPVAPSRPVGLAEDPEPFAGLSNWVRGDPGDYDRGWAVDLVQLRALYRGDPAAAHRGARSRRRQPDAAEIPGPASRRDH